jgi:hypothetical protein
VADTNHDVNFPIDDALLRVRDFFHGEDLPCLNVYDFIDVAEAPTTKTAQTLVFGQHKHPFLNDDL